MPTLRPLIADGWLKVPYTGADVVLVEIGTGRDPEAIDDWTPAFLDYHDGQRVAQIRASQLGYRTTLWLRVGGAVRNAGMVP